ncbi:hypothetical protein A5653_02855 [Mycobacterium colombiense]|nr:hypothetical protein A5653_02855 [Mycobacterium colombiense]
MLDLKACESALTAAQVAAQTGPTAFWQGRLALLAGSRCSKGDTFSEPAYFDIDSGALRRVTFRSVEDDTDW